MDHAPVGQHQLFKRALPPIVAALVGAALILLGAGAVFDRALEKYAHQMAMRVAPGRHAALDLDLAVGDMARAPLVALDTGDRRVVARARLRLEAAAAAYDDLAVAASLPQHRSVDAARALERQIELAVRPNNPAEDEEIRQAVKPMTDLLVSNSEALSSDVVQTLDRFAGYQRVRRFVEIAIMVVLGIACTALMIAARRREERACAVELQVVRNLEKANSDLEAFAARVAHDLRNPLAPILSGSQLIEHAEVDAKVRRAAERIERSARRLGRMIDMMLDFSRMMHASGNAVCDVPAVVAEVVDQFSEPARAAGVRLEVACPPLRARCEPIVLESALQNLVDNAIKYGRRDGVEPVVDIQGRCVDGSVVVEVEDRGPGVGTLAEERLFSAFSRGVAGGEGVGLGLATARRFIEARGGSIVLRPGRFGGARFEVQLPAA